MCVCLVCVLLCVCPCMCVSVRLSVWMQMLNSPHLIKHLLASLGIISIIFNSDWQIPCNSSLGFSLLIPCLKSNQYTPHCTSCRVFSAAAAVDGTSSACEIAQFCVLCLFISGSWFVECEMCICIMWLLHIFSPLVHYDDARGDRERGGSCHYVNWLSESSVIEVQTHFRLDVLYPVQKLGLWLHF